MRRPWDFEFVRHRRSDRSDRRAREPVAQPVLAATGASRLSIRRRIWPRLVSAIASMRPARHLVDRGDDVGVGGLRVIDIGQHGIDLGALRLDGADQRAVVLVRVKLQAEAMASEIERATASRRRLRRSASPS